MRSGLAAALAGLACSLAAPDAGADVSTWEVDPAHTSAQFAVRHLVVSKVRGHLGKVAGTLRLDGADLEKSSVEATVDVAGVDTANEQRDEHLRAADYLDTGKYPTLTFRSTKIERVEEDRYRVRGELTLRGVTREVVLDAEGSSAPIRDPWGKMRLGGVVRATIERDAFGIGGQSAMEGGGLVMGNDVEVTIDVELTRAPD